MQFPPIEIIFNLHPPIREVCAIKLFYSRRLSCFLCHCSHSNLTLGSNTSCRELNSKFPTCEKQKIEKKHTPKKNNHTHKTIFTWFGNFAYVHEVAGISLLSGKNTKYNIRLQYIFLSIYQTWQPTHTIKTLIKVGPSLHSMD